MPEIIAPLPEGAVLLHIGPQKTGTTAMQGMLASAREDLAAQGVVYPGSRGAHHDEARVVIGMRRGWAHDSLPLPPEEMWRGLVQAVREAPGRAVVSSEFFAWSDAEQRARVVDELGGDRLHLLIAARNPGSLALSHWQQELRVGRADSLGEWLQGPFCRPEPVVAVDGFWSWADAATLVANWSEVLDRDRIRVVVIDETDQTMLPATFEQLLDLTAGTLTSRRQLLSRNRSLTAPEAELLRRTIALTRSQLSWVEFSLFFRSGYARRLLDVRIPPKEEAPPGLPAWAVSQAAAEADASIERLCASGVTVIGDLENLRRIPAAAPVVSVERVPVDLAAEALAGVIAAAQRRIRNSDKRFKRLTRLGATEAPSRLEEISTRELVALLLDRARARIRRPRGPGNRHRTV